MRWNPVGAKLSSYGPYLRYLLHPDHATAAACVYFPVHGVAALGKALEGAGVQHFLGWLHDGLFKVSFLDCF